MSKVVKVSKRKRPFDYEGKEQEAYFLWLEIQYPHIFEMAYHVPNGGKRNASEAARFKKQGVKAGVADIVIDIPMNRYHGFRLELKATPPNDCKLTDSQRDWIERWSKHGYKAVACLGLDAAKKATLEYFIEVTK